MTMEDFVMIVIECFDDFECNYYPNFLTTKIKKKDFRRISDCRWAVNDLIEYVADQIPDHSESYPITDFIDAVVGYEYEKDVFSKVNDRWRALFETARNVAEEVEDILNAAL